MRFYSILVLLWFIIIIRLKKVHDCYHLNIVAKRSSFIRNAQKNKKSKERTRKTSLYFVLTKLLNSTYLSNPIVAIKSITKEKAKKLATVEIYTIHIIILTLTIPNRFVERS